MTYYTHTQALDQLTHWFPLQENGTSVKKEEHTPSKRSPSNGVPSSGETLTLVNGVS